MVLLLSLYLLYFLALYIIFTISEWMVHRYVMHGEEERNYISRDHWKHHRNVQKDMSLEDGGREGLYFYWPETVMIFVIALVEALLLRLVFYALFGVTIRLLVVVGVVVLITLYQSSFWNTIHPDIHHAPVHSNWKYGVPGWEGWKHMFFYSWLKNNHQKHHRVKGEDKGNFNITLPGGDWIFGTL